MYQKEEGKMKTFADKAQVPFTTHEPGRVEY
jgi:hypothetical protein